MQNHPKGLGVQMAATACLYNLTKGELGQKIHPRHLARIINLTMDAMQNFPNHLQVWTANQGLINPDRYDTCELDTCKLESTQGPLTGGPQCRMSNLRNGHVNCHYFSHFHVDLKKLLCRMSILRNSLCHVDNIFSHVDRLHVACRF